MAFLAFYPSSCAMIAVLSNASDSSSKRHTKKEVIYLPMFPNTNSTSNLSASKDAPAKQHHLHREAP